MPLIPVHTQYFNIGRFPQNRQFDEPVLSHISRASYESKCDPEGAKNLLSINRNGPVIDSMILT